MTALTNPPDSKTTLPSCGGVDRPQPDPAVLAQLWRQMRRLRAQQERLAEKLSLLSARRNSRIGGGRSLADWSAGDLERWFGAWEREGLNSNTDTDYEHLHPAS